MTAKQHYTGSAADREPQAWFILKNSSATAISVCTQTTTKETVETLFNTGRPLHVDLTMSTEEHLQLSTLMLTNEVCKKELDVVKCNVRNVLMVVSV